MRGTGHSMRRHPFDITSKGIIVYPDKTVRAHLTGKTEAGKLVRETYEMLVRGEKVLTFMVKEAEVPSKEEIEKLKADVEKEKREKAELQKRLGEMRVKLENVVNTWKNCLIN
jgi:predicted transcriptional regulator